MTSTQIVALARRTVADILAVRGTAPPHVHRGFCVDCDAAVELSRDHVCYCGSRSVIPIRGRAVA